MSITLQPGDVVRYVEPGGRLTTPLIVTVVENTGVRVGPWNARYSNASVRFYARPPQGDQVTVEPSKAEVDVGEAISQALQVAVKAQRVGRSWA